MKTKIIILLLVLTQQNIFSQISQEGKDFLVNLTWDVPLKSSRLGAYNILNKEKKDILYGISPGTGGWPLTAEFKSNPHVKLNSLQERSSVALNLSLFFDNQNRIKERRFIITKEEDFKNFYTIRSLLESFSFRTVSKINDEEQYFEFYLSAASKKPYATATRKVDLVTVIIYDSLIK